MYSLLLISWGTLGLIIIGVSLLCLAIFILILLRKNRKELLVKNVELENYSKSLEKRNQELDAFAYIVSHDLKAPLRALSTLSTFVEQDLAKGNYDKVKENLALIRSRTARMSELIEGILNFAKSTKVTGEVEKVDVKSLIIEISELFKERGVVFEINENLPVIHHHKVFLYQIFLNLICNAIIHNDKDVPTVEIGCSDHQGFEFYVKDNGPGIEELYLDKIFVVFQTLKPRDEFESTGIGLSIVKKIVEELNGNIRVESTIGSGSIFFVSLS